LVPPPTACHVPPLYTRDVAGFDPVDRAEIAVDEHLAVVDRDGEHHRPGRPAAAGHAGPELLPGGAV